MIHDSQREARLVEGTVVAQLPSGLYEIEIDGPHRVTAAITRDAVTELGLTVGMRVTAAVKATSVMVERDDR